MFDANLPEKNSVSDPVSLIGASVLGAFGHWLFRILKNEERPGKNGGNARTSAYIKQLDERLGRIEGTVRGHDERLKSLEL